MGYFYPLGNSYILSPAKNMRGKLNPSLRKKFPLMTWMWVRCLSKDDYSHDRYNLQFVARIFYFGWIVKKHTQKFYDRTIRKLCGFFLVFINLELECFCMKVYSEQKLCRPKICRLFFIFLFCISWNKITQINSALECNSRTS
jgi:hypothetical protein